MEGHGRSIFCLLTSFLFKDTITGHWLHPWFSVYKHFRRIYQRCLSPCWIYSIIWSWESFEIYNCLINKCVHPRTRRRLGWRRRCQKSQAAGGFGGRERTVQSSRCGHINQSVKVVLTACPLEQWLHFLSESLIVLTVWNQAWNQGGVSVGGGRNVHISGKAGLAVSDNSF